MSQTNFKLAVDIIEQAISELLPPEDPQNDKGRKVVGDLLGMAEDGYILVQWPDSQEYMKEEWFEEEAIFCGGSEEKTGSSAYFIPIKRIMQ